MTTKKSKEDAFIDAVADAVAEDVEITEAQIDAGHARAMSILAAARREALKQASAQRAAQAPPSIPSRILAMTRETILARLAELQAAFPGQLALAHRKLDEVSLGDLQSLLADAEHLTASGDPDDA